MRDLMKPTDVATQLGVSRAWLYEAAKLGRVPSIRVGGPDGPVRFVPEDIESWIDEARAAWLPGRASVPTRRRGAREIRGHAHASRAILGGEQDA
jgi:predicted DNA-binding transcriptional regulator AlpA